MAKTKKKAKDELDELEDLEDLDEEDEEDEPVGEVEDDDDEETEDEDVPAKKSGKTKKSKKRDDGKVGTSELATALGTSGRELRVMLRQHKVGKNENNRYEWDSVDEALDEMGFKNVKAAQKALAESRSKRLEELKDRVAKSKKGKKGKGKAKAAPEPDDDEDDEDDE